MTLFTKHDADTPLINRPFEKQHKQPCNECPWRKGCAPGWLGGVHSPDDWLEIAHGETIVDCHMRSDGAQCAGLATYRANVSKKPRDPAILVLPKSANVFETPMQFKDHHEIFKGNRTTAKGGKPSK